jgi:CheY-like chemotaxis protein
MLPPASPCLRLGRPSLNSLVSPTEFANAQSSRRMCVILNITPVVGAVSYHARGSLAERPKPLAVLVLLGESEGLRMALVRVLVVDDFEPFRRFICSTLKKKQDLHVICEVSDGLKAVQKAQELKPDLILLDIGLPTLNGIEAARQIRKLSPESKIIFVSNESSPGVVQEALNLGALGYIMKTGVASDLLAAVEAVRQGRRFVSGLLGQHFTDVSPGTGDR